MFYNGTTIYNLENPPRIKLDTVGEFPHCQNPCFVLPQLTD